MGTSFKIMEGNGTLCNATRCFLLWAIIATIIAFSCIIALAVRGRPQEPEPRPTVRWCSESKAEHDKCQRFASAMDSISSVGGGSSELVCVRPLSSGEECVDTVAGGRADVVNVDGGLLVDRRTALKPVMAEDYGEGLASYWAVAVVKKTSNGTVSLTREGMEGKRSCHTGYKKTAGWNFPIGTLLKLGILEPPASGEECDPLQLAKDLFSEMCAPGSDACGLCMTAECPRSCDGEDYCGYKGAFRCLVEAGDVAFVKHTTVTSYTDGESEEEWAVDQRSSDYELLCVDGTRAPVTSYRECSLGRAPSHAVVVSRDADDATVRRVQEFLRVAELRFGYHADDSGFRMFDQGDGDLMFKSSTRRLLPLAPSCQADDFLGKEYLDAVTYATDCVDGGGTDDDGGVTSSDQRCLLPQDQPETVAVDELRWCVVRSEEGKCEDMRQAAANVTNQLRLSCVVAENRDECTTLIGSFEADVTSMDGGEIFEASRRFNLLPVAAEIYSPESIEDSGTTYFAVAVSRSNDSLRFDDLANATTCHTGYGKTAGWVMPIGTLAEQGQLVFDPVTCDVTKQASDLFAESCVPGVATDKSTENLCALCADDDCSTSGAYYGYEGALSCMVEGGGEVAFVKHTTFDDYLEKNPDSTLSKKDFHLLCPDGTTAEIDQFRLCNLAEVPAHALMMSPRHQTEYRDKLWRFLADLQSSEFDLFDSSDYGEDNLMFGDSTECLGKIDSSCAWQDYLGESYLNAVRKIKCVNNPPLHAFQSCLIEPAC